MSSNNRKIIIRGAKQHNLKNITLELPRDKLIVFTGVSGSGKSSLAFDTLYAEGQRRYVESLSAYARQFLERMDKPDVEHIEGLSPAIAIEQKAASKNPRSTVATVTEIHDYMRVLWARIGVQHCHLCGKPITSQTLDQMVERLMSLPEGTRLYLLAPVVRDRKGEYDQIFEDARRDGFARVRVDGHIIDLSEEIKLDKRRKHNIEIVIDRLVIRPRVRNRLAESMETALNVGKGMVIAQIGEDHDVLFSAEAACVDCGVSFSRLEPQMFSFNSPQGMCRACNGVGMTLEVDVSRIVPNPKLSLRQGAVELLGNPESQNTKHILEALERHFGIDLDKPFAELPEEHKEIILRGSDEVLEFRYVSRGGHVYRYYRTYDGVLNAAERQARNAANDSEFEEYHQYLARTPCPVCKGGRLRAESAAVLIDGKSICDVARMSVDEAFEFFTALQDKLDERDRAIAAPLLKEICERLGFMRDVGLGYLTLDRSAPTLSGGEAQRIRLATQIGSSLMGVLYILDEPSIGLHARDCKRLLATLKKMRDLGNTVIVVEHDEETIRNADFIVDFGPGAGVNGGNIVVAGPLSKVINEPRSITGDYLAGRRRIPIGRRRPVGDKWLVVRGARHNNLKNIDVRFPIGCFTCVTGVSGSGKSTLVNDILLLALQRELYGARVRPGEHKKIEGVEYIDKVINIDQSPIGRTPRSNPATYIGVFTPIRETFAQLPEARMRGYKPGRFSFNVRGGRCDACEGDGLKKVEMLFLPDVYVTCEVCKGSRFNQETLQVKFKGKSIADVLAMTVDEAYELFKNIPRIERLLRTLKDVGLGYIQLGQPATTLSGGEAQRVKLARELGKRSTGKTLYLLDEPTTGLHFADVEKLLAVLQRLVDAGNTVIVIEHQMDVIKCADYIVDLGPEGGEEGGRVVVAGTPEEVAQCPYSYTGQILRRVLQRRRARVA